MRDFLFLALAAIALSSCADVSGALFAGRDGTYDFKNDYLDSGFQVDESKIHLLDYQEDKTAPFDLIKHPVFQKKFLKHFL